MLTVTHQGRTFVLEVRGPLRQKWNPVDRDADEKAGTDLIAKVLTDKDAVQRMGRGEIVTMRLGDGQGMEFRFSLPEGGFAPGVQGTLKESGNV